MIDIINELYHYGVKGMKWGVRRYQNLDGSSSVQGGTRHSSNKDSDKLAKRLAEHTEAFAVYDTNTTRYYNRNTGNTIAVGDPKHQKNARITKERYENLKALLNKKYDSVEAGSSVQYATGKAHVTVTLKKNGQTSITELESTFDPVSDSYMESLYRLMDT